MVLFLEGIYISVSERDLHREDTSSELPDLSCLKASCGVAGPVEWRVGPIC